MTKPYLSVLYSYKIHKYRIIFGYFGYSKFYTKKNQTLMTIVRDMKKGDILTKENIRAIRPGLGLAPKYYDILLGKRIKKDVKIGTALQWRLI